ncbi:MAG: FHA domain-containing protein [Pirellulales bacterium]|nr:FHA domain-containing protein [Pirellulales bacterium]
MFKLEPRLRGLTAMDYRGSQQFDKFMLWIDAVGGFWVCLGDKVTLGQPTACGTVDVPILADISSRHARIRRDGEGYLIEAIREVQVDGLEVEKMAALSDGSRITLGEGVRLAFRRPHALSATARLDFASHHRTQPSADAVLLMADSCVLGPKSSSHVVCREWDEEVILYRHDEQLYCRTKAALTIDGVRYQGRGRITVNSHIEGEGFSLSLEGIRHS